MGVRNESISRFLMLLVVFASVISQNYVFRETMPVELICDAIWVLAFVVILLMGKGKFETSFFLNTYVLFIFLKFIIINVFKNAMLNSQYSLSVATFLPAPLLIYIVSHMYFRRQSKREALGFILDVLQISGVLLSITLWFGLQIDWHSWFTSYVYVMDNGKNAIGHVLAILVLINIFYRKLNATKKLENLIWSIPIRVLACFLYVSVILYLQCRTALLAISIILVIAGMFLIKDYRIKLGLVSAIVIAALAVIFNEDLNALISHALFLDKYKDVNSFSSGRLGIYANAIVRLGEHLLLGSPNVEYVDNFYINTLLNSGVIIGGLQFVLLFVRVVFNLSYSKQCYGSSALTVTIYVITFYELITSIVEALPPFGPGVSVMVFWMLSAYCDASMNEERETVNE